MNSFHERVNAKRTAHTRPGMAMGKTMLQSAWTRVAPSTIAHSSTSLGTVRKYPISSQVQNGTRNVGYVTTSAHFESASPSQLMTWASGRKRSDVGTRYVTKMPVPKLFTPKNLSRESAYAAMVPMITDAVVASAVTIRLFFVQVRNSVSHKSFV